MNVNVIIAVLERKGIITREEGEKLVEFINNKPQPTLLADAVAQIEELVSAAAPKIEAAVKSAKKTAAKAVEKAADEAAKVAEKVAADAAAAGVSGTETTGTGQTTDTTTPADKPATPDAV